MDIDHFKPLFHESWHSKILPFIESEECDKIYKFLKKEGRRGKKIAPLSINTYRAFLETPLDSLKLVILGMCPYHTFHYDKPVADGLLMSCSSTKRLQPSLDKFYDGIIKELYPGERFDKSPDLSFLAKQGVLLLNAALTVEMNKAGSHNLIWEPFTKYLFETVLETTGMPVLFLGKEAAKFERYVMPFTFTFKLSHPASASYKDDEWETDGVFTKINNLIKMNNNEEINWLNP